MPGDPGWMKTYYHAPHEKDSKYKGVFRNIMIASIAGRLNVVSSDAKTDDGRPLEQERWMWSPADGLITDISEKTGPEELRLENTSYTKVSVFMNVFNCHVNRIPTSGKIEEIFYKPGKFLNASLDKASEDNERNYYKLKDNHGNDIVVVQIAGLVARRIVCETNKDQTLNQGDRIGMIRFGSRADVYYENYEPLVKIGQTAISGETLLAKR